MRHSVPRHAALSRAVAMACLLGPFAGLTAHAELSDTLHPFLSTTITHDDNLLRLANDNAISETLADTYKEVAGGIRFERPLGRQLFTGQVKLTKVTFDHFDQLDYNGKQAEINWKWVLGNHLSGDAGGTYEQTLAPFSDYSTDQRNLRVHRREYANAAWLFHPRWQARVGLSRDELSYDLSIQRLGNRREDMTELGVDYLSPSGSKVGVQARHLAGSYPNGTLNGVLINDPYTQDELKANITWVYSGNTQIQFLGGWARRSHDEFTTRDDSGANGRLMVYWSPLNKVKFTGSTWREFAAVESSAVNSSLNKGASLAATWTATGKITVDALVRRETRDFQAISTLRSGGLQDVTRTSSLSVTYLPLRNVQLMLTAYTDDRDGSLGVGTTTYRAKGASFNAKVEF